ncbi:Flp pilus assembly protein TadB [Kineococcus xinjiangensis]|uniref:Flp pilus assembly protein TadB n=1 Tax=Kineococcus xinjiangensis TaxID=512762 RepID=A0A2S6IXA3_9ACTN|nr:type II secretion system F family protein [Kineococcus xinjiangensis]PPK98781.1 Flp pilus assembly protein TadB [Kineococcus xinjiangensis]
MTLAVLCGAVVGAGLFLLARLLLPQRTNVAVLVSRIDAGRRSLRGETLSEVQAVAGLGGGARAGMDRLADLLEVQAAERGWQLHRTRRDLALVNRSLGSFLATKLLAGVGLFLLVPFCWAALRVSGVPLPAAVPLVLGLVLGALGAFLPDLALRGEAEQRRRDFRRVVGVFLDLVAMNLAGGRGLPEALLASASVSDYWALVRIRQSLANARLMGTTPWEALGDLGRDIGVEELEDLAGALTLAADDGAKIRSSLSARSATMRRREMSDSEGQAGERSQSMLVAQMLLCCAFLLFLAYPAVDGLLAQG